MEEKEAINTADSTEQEETISKKEKKSKKDIKTEKKEQDSLEKLEEEVKAAKDEHLRLYAEFDNYRKRTAKERIDLIRNASQQLLTELLPVLDDFERGIQQLGENATEDEGMVLIYNKFKGLLEKNGLKPMEARGETFDPELHEAITEIPAPTEDLKEKVVDEIEKGYYLNDKIIRYAKVVVGK